jgi:hypothetical protein
MWETKFHTRTKQRGKNIVLFSFLYFQEANKKAEFLVNDQRHAQFFTMYLFLFLYLTLYVFRAHRAHHQERQIVSTQPLVTVTLKIGG